MILMPLIYVSSLVMKIFYLTFYLSMVIFIIFSKTTKASELNELQSITSYAQDKCNYDGAIFLRACL
jgi:hypothetical protein